MVVEMNEVESVKVLKEKSFDIEAEANETFRGHCEWSKNSSRTGFWEFGQEECMEDERITPVISIGVVSGEEEIDQTPKQVESGPYRDGLKNYFK
jgi:hypothetical protein